MIINRDLNIDQNNRDYHFGHNRAALDVMLSYVLTLNLSLTRGRTCLEASHSFIPSLHKCDFFILFYFIF